MNSVSVAAAALVLAAAGAPAAGSSPTDADALLYAATSAPAKVSYTGVVEVVRLGSRAAEASVYRIEHQAPDLTRRLYSAPSALSGDAVISKGELSFSVDTRRHRVVETRNAAVDDRIAIHDDYALLRRNYTIVEKGEETFDGRPTVGVALINRYNHHPTMMLRIDRVTKVVLDKQEFAPDGSLVGEVRFEEVRYDVGIPPSDFAFPKQYRVVQGPTFGEPPQDPNRVLRSAGFPARAPNALPEGFAPIEGNFIELKGVRTMQLLYSDGIRTVSLFENATASTLDTTGLHRQSTDVAGRSAAYAEDGGMALLAWSDGNLHYALVGEFRLPELRQIAASITP